MRSICVAAACGLALAAGATAADPAPANTAPAAASLKVLRYAMRVAETGFDPAQVTDLYSATMIGNIFDAPYQHEFLARPVRVRPNAAAAMPEVSADFRTFTVRIRPGIYFADDPAFKGVRRELVAADYVYSIKRHFDPRWKSGHLTDLATAQIIGLDALRDAALKSRKPFDYDREIEGLRALDRYTLQFKLADPSPRFVSEQLCDPAVVGAVAREVVEFYGDRIMEHPVGTGPFKLGTWRRSSLIAFDRNPGYRNVEYDEEAPAGDPLAQAAVAKLKGRKLPMVDRVEINIIEQPQPRWLSFINREMDLLWQIPEDFVNVAIPNNKLAPNLAKRGIYFVRYLRNDFVMSYFGMENAVVGGYTPEKVALRRAIGLSVDVQREIHDVRRGQAIPAHSIVAPNVWGYDPAFKSEMGEFDRAKAKALLDLYGYVDRDGDGWRDMPDGSPLVLRMATEPDNTSRQYNDLWRIAANRIGLRIEFAPAKWPENMKSARAGKLMMWLLGSSADAPDGQGALARWYGPSAGAQNLARFKRPEFDALYERMQVMPNGPERLKLFEEAKRLTIAWAPYKIHVHRIYNDLSQPWLVGYRRPVFWNDWWQYVDIDVSKRPTKLAP